MAYELCPRCGWMHYRTDPCRAKKPSPPKKSFVERWTEVIKQMPRTKSTAARKDVPQRDELAGPAQNEDGVPLAPQNDRAGRKVRSKSAAASEAVAGKESVTVGRVTQPEASPRSNGSQAGTQAPPVDATTKRGRGRPKLHPDRKAYKAEKERERRAKLKTEGGSK